MADDMGEKTELPTSRRLSEARNKGQVAKSIDLSASIDMIGGAVLLLIFGSFLVGGMAAVLRYLLDDRVSGSALAPDAVPALAWWALAHSAMLTAPFLAIMFVIAALAHVVQFGLLVSGEAIQPKLDKLNPIAGVGRLFKPRTIIKTLVNALRLAIAAVVTFLIVLDEWPRIAALSLLGVGPGYVALIEILTRILIWVLALLLILGLADFLYQRWQHTQDLMMTKQQVKDEYRSMEGDPEVKGRRLRIARQMASQRLGAAVPTADVVVTNPTHFSVALRYDPKTMAAPVVVAKGADEIALRIRQIAIANAVPIVERPPLARALYAKAPVGKPISAEHYQAVAEILAYVYRLKNTAA
jgi:flagellar biosynthetic protein FlhB